MRMHVFHSCSNIVGKVAALRGPFGIQLYFLIFMVLLQGIGLNED